MTDDGPGRQWLGDAAAAAHSLWHYNVISADRLLAGPQTFGPLLAARDLTTLRAAGLSGVSSISFRGGLRFGWCGIRIPPRGWRTSEGPLQELFI